MLERIDCINGMMTPSETGMYVDVSDYFALVEETLHVMNGTVMQDHIRDYVYESDFKKKLRKLLDR